MQTYIYPIIYKPGINRDNTDFQPEYCTNGQWIRFNKGKIEKIGGMISPGESTNFQNQVVSSILLVPKAANNDVNVYLLANNNISKYSVDRDIGAIQNNQVKTLTMNNGALWNSTIVVDNNVKKVLFLAAFNANNISSNTPIELYSVNESANISTTSKKTITNISQLITGGMYYSAPYLFLYGDNGFVQYSEAGKPFEFKNDKNFVVSTDKVIYAASIRGGSSSPALLFWTLSSVVRAINVGAESVEFRTDIISNSSSILSSRCIVEYDGLFFWIGTDRFFIYNGVVQEMVNNLNSNFFFNNIDMNHRQKVFGVKNPRYGEIWWFYPEKGQDQNNVQNTRAIIYNKRENTWYDVAINRNAAFFSSYFGSMFTHGKSIVNNTDSTFLWKHEEGVKEKVQTTEQEILSSFTTPIFSWAIFNPQNQPTNNDNFISLKRIEPDIVMDNDTDTIDIVVNSFRYPQSPKTQNTAKSFTRVTEKIDFHLQGRNISFTFSTGKNFKLGNTSIAFSLGNRN